MQIDLSIVRNGKRNEGFFGNRAIHGLYSLVGSVVYTRSQEVKQTSVPRLHVAVTTTERETPNAGNPDTSLCPSRRSAGPGQNVRAIWLGWLLLFSRSKWAS